MGVRVKVRFLLFYYELGPLTRDVTCSKLYFDGKKYEEAMSDEHPPEQTFASFTDFKSAQNFAQNQL